MTYRKSVLTALPCFVILGCALLLLNGCTTLPGKSWLRQSTSLTDYNPQNFQGCTVGEYIRPYAAPTDEDEEIMALMVRWWDCKNKAQVSGEVDLNADGTPDFIYSASDVVGSTAAQIRAEVEKAFSDNGVEVIQSVVDGIVEALKPTP